jgi:preprotein translocase subunit SecY
MIAIWIIKTLFTFVFFLSFFIAIGQAVEGQFPRLFVTICVICLAIIFIMWLIEKTTKYGY